MAKKSYLDELKEEATKRVRERLAENLDAGVYVNGSFEDIAYDMAVNVTPYSDIMILQVVFENPELASRVPEAVENYLRDAASPVDLMRENIIECIKEYLLSRKSIILKPAESLRADI